MRAILILVFVVVILALVGWVTFSRDGDRTSINIETQEIKDDSRKMIESGKSFIEKAEEKIDETIRPEAGNK